MITPDYSQVEWFTDKDMESLVRAINHWAKKEQAIITSITTNSMTGSIFIDAFVVYTVYKMV